MLPRLTAIIPAAALLLTGCAVNETNAQPAPTATAPALSGTLTGIGASSQDVAQQTWIAGFQSANPGVTVNYSPEGSGTGRESFIAGGTDFAGSDRAFRLDELTGQDFGRCAPGTTPLDLPVYISPIAVVFNVEGVDSLNMTPQTLAKVFSGAVTNWNDPAIAADNPGLTLPDLPITAVYRADKSGTTGNFTEYLHAAAGDAWTEEPGDTWPFRHGEAATQTQGVVAAVGGGVGTIGYLDASQATSFSTVKIGRDGNFNGPTAEAAAMIVAASPEEEGRAEGDLAIELDRGGDGYPIVLVSYLIVCSDYADDETAARVRAYATHVVSEAGQQAAQQRAGSAPLTAELRDRVLAAIASVK